MEVRVITDVGAANEPLLKVLGSGSTPIVHQFLKYENQSDNDTELIKKMAIASRVLAEKFLNLSLAEKTIEVFFPREYIKRRSLYIDLPYGPVSNITSVKSINDQGTEADLTLNDTYNILGKQFKTVRLFEITGTFNGVSAYCDYLVRYVAGYGVATEGYTTEAIPEAIVQAMLKSVFSWFNNRENWLPVLTEESKMMMYPFRRVAWF